MGKHDTTELRNTLQQAFGELKSLVLTTPPGMLGPPSLLDYELSALEQALAEAERSHNPTELQQRLVECRKLLNLYKAELSSAG